jgi:hypothetical protein
MRFTTIIQNGMPILFAKLNTPRTLKKTVVTFTVNVYFVVLGWTQIVNFDPPAIHPTNSL